VKWDTNLIRLFFIFVVLVTSSFSKDLVELYLQGDKEKIEKYFENKLITKEYWNKKLSNSDYRYGYYENSKTVLVACKECLTLKYFDINGTIKQINDFNATFGKVSGDKYVEGDLKTPVGVYEFVNKLSGKSLDQYYGPAAFVTNYPNLFDKVLEKNGYGIWLHGYPLNGDRDDLKTKGCIAVENNYLTFIENIIDYKNSIIIVNEKRELTTSKEELVSILVEVFKWRKAWKESDIESYMSFYSKDFQRRDGLKYDKFKIFKKGIFDRNEFVELFVEDLEIVPYPNSVGKKIFRVKFLEDYKSNLHSFRGYKELYVEKIGQQIKILVES